MNQKEVKERLLSNPEVQQAFDNPPLPLLIARSVVEYRRSLDLSQAQLAQLLGTSQNQVWRIESGDENITVKTLEKLREVFGMRFSIEPPNTPTPLVSRELGNRLG